MMWRGCHVAWLVGTAGVLLAGCAETQLAIHTAKQMVRQQSVTQPPPPGTADGRGGFKVGKPYQIKGVWYYPRADPNYNETGIASWYGRPFHGRRTANGEIFDMNKLTAAHRTLPLPSYVRVTNLQNGRALSLKVNDRGPFAHGRIIDVSRRAAQLLGFVRNGTARVRVEIIGATDRDIFVASKPRISEEEKRMVVAAPRTDVTVAALPAPGQEGPGSPVISDATPSSAAGPPTPPPASDEPALTEQVDLVPVGPTKLYIQAGAFARYENANRLAARLSPFGDAKISQILLQDHDFFRVRMGPLDSVDAADRLLERLIRNGHSEARIIVD